jgi:hypothetical protein
MSTEFHRETLPANGRVVLPPNNFLFLFTIPHAVTVQFKRGGTTYGGVGVGAGYIKKELIAKSWDECTIIGTAGDVIEFYDGTEEFSEADTDIRTQLATLSGVSSVIEAAPHTLVAVADAVVAVSGKISITNASTSKQRVTIGLLSTSAAAAIRIQGTGQGDGFGTEISPGTRSAIELGVGETFDVYNESTSGGNAIVTHVLEQF